MRVTLARPYAASIRLSAVARVIDEASKLIGVSTGELRVDKASRIDDDLDSVLGLQRVEDLAQRLLVELKIRRARERLGNRRFGGQFGGPQNLDRPTAIVRAGAQCAQEQSDLLLYALRLPHDECALERRYPIRGRAGSLRPNSSDRSS